MAEQEVVKRYENDRARNSHLGNGALGLVRATCRGTERKRNLDHFASDDLVCRARDQVRGECAN